MQLPKPRAVVAFSTMWHSTERLAEALADGIRSAGVEVKVMDLHVNDRSAVMTEVANCGLMGVRRADHEQSGVPGHGGHPLLCEGTAPEEQDRLRLRFLRLERGGRQADRRRADRDGAEQPCELFQVKYMPTAEDMKRMFENGEKLGRLLLERVK